MMKKPVSDRLPLRLRVKYATIEQFLIDYNENIVKGGSFIKADRPLHPGTRLHLELEVGGVPVFIKLRGRVAWVNDPKGEYHRRDLPPGMGVLFIFPDDASKLILKKLVERLESVPKARQKDISPAYLEDIIKSLRPDIQQLVREKGEQSDSEIFRKHIGDIFDEEK